MRIIKQITALIIIPGHQSIFLHRHLWNIKPIFFNGSIDHRNRRGYGKSRKQEFIYSRNLMESGKLFLSFFLCLMERKKKKKTSTNQINSIISYCLNALLEQYIHAWQMCCVNFLASRSYKADYIFL